MKSILPLVALLILTGCEVSKEQVIKEKVGKYFAAWNRQDFESSDFATFKKDTSYTWHGEKKGEGSRSIFNPNSGWKQWDKAWNGTYSYDIIEINVDQLYVSGRFTETTDFLKIIGMPEGFSATVTFWFDDDYRVKETLYDWDPDNQSMHDKIKPLVEWAKVNDSTAINQIYLRDGFKPSTANATEWKKLLDSYMNSGGKFAD